MEFYGQVLSEAAKVPDASETTADLLAGETVIPLARVGDFVEGSHVQIDGTVYAFDDDLTDDGEESGVRSITLSDPGLVADVAEGTIVYSWNPNANEGAGDVHCEWQVQVAPAGESDGHTATLADSLVPTTSPNKPPGPGDSVRVLIDDDSSWLVVEKVGGTPGVYPAFFRTGGLGADTVVWAGTENGRRAQLDGIDGALEAFNDANEQTVNLDGVDNYIEGTLATAADGPRIELGETPTGGFPNNEVRAFSGSDDELGPAKIISTATEAAPGVDQGLLDIQAHEFDGDGNRPLIRLGTGGSTFPSVIAVSADEVHFTAGAGVFVDEGAVNATMGDGSVGTSTFRDSVDARVNALAASATANQETANRIASGVEVFSRETAATTTAMTSGTLRLTYFTAYADMTVASLKSATGATAAATPTTCKMGLYSIDGSGNLTRIGITANDTTVWNAATTAFTKALTSPVAITKGTRYVFAALYVGTTAPVLVARTVSQAIGNSNNRLMGAVAGQTDIPSSITAGTVGVAGVQVYGELIP